MDGKRNGSMPAYPVIGAPGALQDYGGFTKREMIASLVMPAIITAYIEANGRCLGTEHVAYNTAAHAVRIADALLHELAKEPK